MFNIYQGYFFATYRKLIVLNKKYATIIWAKKGCKRTGKVTNQIKNGAIDNENLYLICSTTYFEK